MASLFKRVARSIHMGRIVPEINPEIARQIEEDSSNVKKLKTRRHMGFVSLPIQLELAAQAKLKQKADANFRKEAKELINRIYNLRLPDERDTIPTKRADIKTELEMRNKIKSDPAYDPRMFRLKEDIDIAHFELRQLIEGTLEERRRDWHYFEYDEYSSNLYMAVRLAPNYAALKTVMDEIKDLDQHFEPKSVLDFGSGMGTTIWAVNQTWPNCVQEFMNIDISKEQQYLCNNLLRGGREFGDHAHNVFHKEYLPVSTKVKYDMVVAAFSMLDLPNSQLRAQTIENLWNKTSDILVLVERGNSGGFSIINEARHFILDLAGHDVTRRVILSTEKSINNDLYKPQAHVLAPCPHEFTCPRATMTAKKRRDVCRFRIVFEPLEFGQQKRGFIAEEFSYVVLRKRPFSTYFNETDSRWPRIVERRRRGHKQVTHKLCCPNGCLAETTLTRKRYGDSVYELAKSCDWGDILPIRVRDTYVKSAFINKNTPNDCEGINLAAKKSDGEVVDESI